jgi:hypothetical protein
VSPTATAFAEGIRARIEVTLHFVPHPHRSQPILQASLSDFLPLKDAQAPLSVSLKEEDLTQQKVKEMEERTPECSHGDLEAKIKELERQLSVRAPDHTELTGELEDANAQLEITRKLAEEYQEQVTRILKLTEGRTGRGGNYEDREKKGNGIARLSGEDRKELRGWKVQLALKIAGKPRAFDSEQKKMRYVVGRLEKVALPQIM